MKKFLMTILIVICIIIFIILFIGATVFSIYKFKVFNPISSCFGMLQILFTDKEYTVVQRIPYKVVLAKPNSFEKYMDQKGFYNIPEEQTGADHVYTNGTKKVRIYRRTNAYYSIGIWDNHYET